jgi:integrase
MTTAAAALPVADFAQFATAATDRAIWRPGIQVFLATLAQCTDAQNIERVALDARGKILEANESINSANRICTAYRKAIVEWQKTIILADWNTTEASATQLKQGWAIDGRVHLALKFVTLGKEIHAIRNAATAAKTESQRTARVPFDPFAAISAAERALKSADIKEVAAGFIFLTGRRPTEVWRRQGFKVTGRYTIDFSGQLKEKGSGGEAFTIYCLTDSNRIIDAIAKLNRSPDAKELDGDSNEKIQMRRGSATNSTVRRIFGAIIEPPVGKKWLSATNLRAAYTVAAATLFKPPGESISHFAQSVLGHKDVSQTLNYEDYYASDDEGNELVTGQWRDRLLEAAPVAASQKKSSITADQQLLDELKGIPGATQAERLRTAISSYSELEGIKERHYAEVQRLKAKITQLEQELTAMKGQTESPTSTAQDRPEQATERVGVLDYTTMPSEVLRKSQGAGSTPEKLRRAMGAIVAFNESKLSGEQYKLSAANLRKVSGCRHTSVVAWIAENEGEIDAYNTANGLSGTQADRGKEPIETLIAQGLFEW